jgi:ATP-dependent Clp protease ATP-binding subunit ClpX
MSKVGSSDSKNTLYCSFCGKSQHEVRKLTRQQLSDHVL